MAVVFEQTVNIWKASGRTIHLVAMEVFCFQEKVNIQVNCYRENHKDTVDSRPSMVRFTRETAKQVAKMD